MKIIKQKDSLEDFWRRFDDYQDQKVLIEKTSNKLSEKLQKEVKKFQKSKKDLEKTYKKLKE